jgi:hypothetical protein
MYSAFENCCVHPQVIDNEQRHAGQYFHVFFASPIDGSIGDFLKQGVSLTVNHAVALPDDRMSDGCARWLLPVPVGPRKSASSWRATNVSSGQIEDQLRFIFLLKLKLSSVFCGSRNCACFLRRSSSCSLRRVSSSDTRQFAVRLTGTGDPIPVAGWK